MPDPLTDIRTADLQIAVEDLEFQNYIITDKINQGGGLWTIQYREKSTAGLTQTPTDNDAVAPEPEAPKPAPPTPPGPPTPSTPTGGPQTLRPEGAKLIKAFEACAKHAGNGSFRAYNDAIGVLTIGWGHTNNLGRRFDPSATWTQQECDDAFGKIWAILKPR